MRYYQCKCGNEQWVGSYPPPSCVQCKTCGTTLAEGPDGHLEPRPHEFVERMVITDAGMQPLTVCRFCNQTKREIEARESAQATESV